MAWKTVKIDAKKVVRGTPTASIGHGKISLNVAACNLIDDNKQYNHVELQDNPEFPGAVGILFLKEATENSIVIKRKTTKDEKTKESKTVGGIEIFSKAHMEKLFGEKIGTAKVTTKYSVTKEEPNFLVLSPKA